MMQLYAHNPSRCPRCQRHFDVHDPDDFRCDCAFPERRTPVKKAWEVAPNGVITEVELDDSTEENLVYSILSQAHARIGHELDFTRVIWDGRRRSMIVDDLGHAKGLPVNAVATGAYLAACVPGTTHHIRGTTLVVEGLLL